MKFTSTFFKPWELVPKSVYDVLGVNSLIVMDERILISIENIRRMLNRSIVVNNWHEGGAFEQRGFRDSYDVGAQFSSHRFGRAIDFDVQGMSANDVRAWIINHQKDLPYITRMERDVNWVHIDCAAVDNKNGILLFKG